MLSRNIYRYLKQRLNERPAVALLGPRQVGKTTLARDVMQEMPSIYLDLESPADQNKLHDPLSYFTKHQDELVILDEIQRVPDLFMVLRGVIDEYRMSGRRAGHFLFLGSASMDLMRQSSETLAGRISYLEMTGLNILEIDEETDTLWLRGGFPDSYLCNTDTASMLWLDDLIRTYLQRDVPQFGFNIPADTLKRLWMMLAHLQGETLNASRIAANLDISRVHVNQYIHLLVDLLLVRRLEPWFSNVKKRLVKSSRYYVRDSGILHALLGIHDYEALISNPVMGKSWEGFVIENIHSVLPQYARTYFYRTAAGAEIDLIIELSASERWAVEIKYGVAPKVSKSFHQSCDDIKATHRFVVYGGDESFPMKGLEMMTLPDLMQKISALN